jgi:hypothetical protein
MFGESVERSAVVQLTRTEFWLPVTGKPGNDGSALFSVSGVEWYT